MQKTIIFEEAINKKTVTRLVANIEDALATCHNVTLYFSSEGGELPYAAVLSDFLNANKEHITLVGQFTLQSAGFAIYYNFTGCKKLLPYTLGMIHQSCTHLCIREQQRSSTMSAIQAVEWRKQNDHQFDTYKDLMTEEEQIRYQLGEEIIFDSERMQIIFAPQIT